MPSTVRNDRFKSEKLQGPVVDYHIQLTFKNLEEGNVSVEVKKEYANKGVRYSPVQHV